MLLIGVSNPVASFVKLNASTFLLGVPKVNTSNTGKEMRLLIYGNGTWLKTLELSLVSLVS